jgi:hypothetical protein
MDRKEFLKNGYIAGTAFAAGTGRIGKSIGDREEELALIAAHLEADDFEA